MVFRYSIKRKMNDDFHLLTLFVTSSAKTCLMEVQTVSS